MGFFIIGWDEDTVETYHRTLDFCDECNLTPFIFTLHPTPGSQVYREYLEEGRIFTDRPWDQYGGGFVVFEHPSMSERDMLEANAQVMLRGYSMRRIAKRTLHAARRRFSMDFAMTTFFTQLGLRKTYRQMDDEIRARYSN